MRFLLFLMRVTFICGISYLLALSMQYFNWSGNSPVVSTIVILSHIVGGVLLIVTHLSLLVIAFTKRSAVKFFPRWLIIANIFFLVIFIVHIFYLNDPYYHQK